MSARASSRRRTRGMGAIFAWPLLLAVLSLVGLIVGLTGDGARDVVAWLLLGTTLVAIGHAFFRARKTSAIHPDFQTRKTLK